MLVKTKAIVISALRFQEKGLIVKCFTETDGLKTYFIRSAYSQGKSAQKIAYFQPLTLLEIEAVHKNKGTLESIKDIRLAVPFQTANTDIIKSTMLMFIGEVLSHSIREEERNADLYAFLETALLWLDTHDQTSNFHLILMMEATKFLGFYPEVTQVSEPFFEMTDGIFTTFHGISCLSAEDTNLLRRLIGLRFSGSQNVFSGSERQQLLKILIDYYSLHLDGFKRPKSLEVLKEVFS